MSYRVLIVDDDDDSRSWVQRALGAAGFDIAAATTGAGAFAYIASDDIDLVIAERTLRETDGMRLVWRIKAEFPSVAVVVMTGIGSTRSAIDAMRLGAEDYLVKPFDAETLVAVARRAIESPPRALIGRPPASP